LSGGGRECSTGTFPQRRKTKRKHLPPNLKTDSTEQVKQSWALGAPLTKEVPDGKVGEKPRQQRQGDVPGV